MNRENFLYTLSISEITIGMFRPQLVDNLNRTRPLGTDHYELLNTHRAGPVTTALLPVTAFVLFTLLSLTRSARQCGLFSFFSLLCFGAVLALIFFFMLEGSYSSLDVPHKGRNITDPVHQLLDAFSQLYIRNHRLMFTQSVGGVSNSPFPSSSSSSSFLISFSSISCRS